MPLGGQGRTVPVLVTGGQPVRVVTRVMSMWLKDAIFDVSTGVCSLAGFWLWLVHFRTDSQRSLCNGGRFGSGKQTGGYDQEGRGYKQCRDQYCCL